MNKAWTFICLFSLFVIPIHSAELPQGFVYVTDIIPDIAVELRYFTNNNFVGEKIDGYLKDRCIMSKRAAYALKEVQGALKKFGLGLKIFDAYRPQQAVDHFKRWAGDLFDTRMKSAYYPETDKKNLFKEGYIASRSGHSRGSTIDLTLIDLKTGEELDMGSPWDFFSEISWVNYPNLQKQQRANRMLLNSIMQENGFKSYSKEWWHFTLRIEPFPKKYFNFPVE